MEDKRLTAHRVPLNFEVCTRDPIGVGKRNGRHAVKPDIQKPSVGAEGFCLLQLARYIAASSVLNNQVIDF